MNDGLILIVVWLYVAGAVATHLWARSVDKDWQMDSIRRPRASVVKAEPTQEPPTDDAITA
jgi:hypothetical protein